MHLLEHSQSNHSGCLDTAHDHDVCSTCAAYPLTYMEEQAQTEFILALDRQSHPISHPVISVRQSLASS
jgi:2-succinyl-5-enolpyruvyl-6-hydroxy-3-cyclohexene-1-carboxylate synthase